MFRKSLAFEVREGKEKREAIDSAGQHVSMQGMGVSLHSGLIGASEGHFFSSIKHDGWILAACHCFGQ